MLVLDGLDAQDELETLKFEAPDETDEDFVLSVTRTVDSDIVNDMFTYNHTVIVQAVADPPTVNSTEDINVNEDESEPLKFVVSPSSDATDGSESFYVTITLPDFGGFPIGNLTTTGSPSVTLVSIAPGVYNVTFPAGVDAAEQAQEINDFVAAGGLLFTPRDDYSGVLTGPDGIQIDAVTEEAANGYGDQLANNDNATDDTVGDFDTKYEIDTGFIDVTVNPRLDGLTNLNNTETVVQENNDNQAVDTPLVVDIGRDLDIAVGDIDGSQSLSLNISVSLWCCRIFFCVLSRRYRLTNTIVPSYSLLPYPRTTNSIFILNSTQNRASLPM